MKLIAAGMAVFLLVSPQMASANEEAKTEKASQKLNCKYERVLGSKIPQKVCKTQAAWDELERERIERRRTDRNRNRSSAG